MAENLVTCGGPSVLRYAPLASAAARRTPLGGYFCADVTIGDCGALRRKLTPFDRRLKWPREHAICHAEVATYVTREVLLYAGLVNYVIVLLIGISIINRSLKLLKWLSISRLRCSAS